MEYSDYRGWVESHDLQNAEENCHAGSPIGWLFENTPRMDSCQQRFVISFMASCHHICNLVLTDVAADPIRGVLEERGATT